MARFRKNRLFLNSSESTIIVINMDGKAEERIPGLLASNRQFYSAGSTFLRHVIGNWPSRGVKEFRILSRNFFLFHLIEPPCPAGITVNRDIISG